MRDETLHKKHVHAGSPTADIVDVSLPFLNASGYDGGDCCQCTCVSTTSFTCCDEFHGGFECLDPSAPCVADDDDTTSLESDGTSYTGETTSSSCIVGLFSDGDCDVFNNNEECGASRSRLYVACDIPPSTLRVAYTSNLFGRGKAYVGYATLVNSSISHPKHDCDTDSSLNPPPNITIRYRPQQDRYSKRIVLEGSSMGRSTPQTIASQRVQLR